MTYSPGLTLKVAEMYYYQKLSQKAIADKLDISVPTVSRILAEALETGQIRVEVVDKSRCISLLESRMKKRFGLAEARVLGLPNPFDPAFLKKMLGKAASDLLYDRAKPKDRIGLGPGGTMLEMVDSLNPERGRPGLSLVPLMGGWGFGGVAYEGNKLLGSAAGALHCDFNLMPCPALVSTREVHDILMREPLIVEIVNLWKNIDIAVLSIGGEVRSGNYPQLRGNESAIAAAGQKGAVGDVLGRFIDAEGRELDLEVNRKIVSIPFAQLSKIPLRIGIGGGSQKIRAIRAALKGKLVNTLVSDESTCEAILKMEEEENE
jgi:deoxyribonucleoside regulator